MSDYYKFKAGLGSSASYQVSATPFTVRQAPGINNPSPVTDPGTPSSIAFDTVTRWIQITSYSNASIRVGFSEAGTATNSPSTTPTNYFVIPPNTTTPRLELKVTELFFMRDDISASTPKPVDVVVGLTSIPATSLENNWSGSIGVG